MRRFLVPRFSVLLAAVVLLAFFFVDADAQKESQKPGEIRATPRGPAEPDNEQVSIVAKHQERIGDTIVCSGEVEIAYKDVKITADEVTFDLKTKYAVAEGNVVIVEGNSRFTGSKVEFNMDTREGTIYNASGYSKDQELYFHGKKIEKVSKNKYIIHGGDVTACDQPSPYWDFKSSRATYIEDRYIRAWNLLWRAKRIPVFYLPVIQYPAKRERTTGFLFPILGLNNQRGMALGDAFFLAMGRSYDAMFTYQYYKKVGHGLDTEFRYRPAEQTEGHMVFRTVYQAVDVPVTQKMYALTADHRQRFGPGFSASAAIDYRNNFNIDSLFHNSLYRSTLTTTRSTGEISKRWPRYSLAVRGRDVRNVSSFGTQVQRNLPEVDFKAFSRQLGKSPVVFDLDSSSDTIALKDPSATQYLNYMRFDAFPRISVPLKKLPWLQFNPTIAFRETYYTKRRPPNQSSGIVEQGLERHYYRIDATIRGPVFNRIFQGSETGYATKYKHVIEPNIRYTYIPEFDPNAEAIFYDSIDIPFQSNEIGVSLINRFIAKRKMGSSKVEIPYEFLTVELNQSFSLDPDLPATSGTGYFGRRYLYPGQILRTVTPLQLITNFKPTSAYNAIVKFGYDTHAGQFLNWQIQGVVNTHGARLNLSWLKLNRVTTSDRIDNHLIANGGFRMKGEMLQFEGGLTYNFLTNMRENFYARVKLRGQCVGIGFGYMKWNLVRRTDHEFRITLWLKNIGEIFDYNFGSSSTMGGSGYYY